MMTHDIQDLLNLIKELEERILILESAQLALYKVAPDSDSWYWDH